jgi:hypothetical protein
MQQGGRKITRGLLQTTIVRRMKWMSLCQNFGPGLLPILPLTSSSPYFIGRDDLLKLSNDEITEFHNLTSIPTVAAMLKTLCAVGQSFIDMVNYDQKVMYRFEWMGHHVLTDVVEQPEEEQHFDEPPTSTPEEYSVPAVNVLISRVQVQPQVEGNLFVQELDWPRLSDARRSRDPTIVNRGDEQCTACGSDQSCRCVANLSQNRHAIAICSRGNRVVMASLPETPGGPVYQKGAYISELVGDLYPPKHDDCHGMFFALPCPGQDCTSHLHWTKTANWTFLVSHSCKACTLFSVQVLSGKARVMLQAIESICPGTILTVDYRRFSGKVDKLQNCMHCQGPCNGILE